MQLVPGPDAVWLENSMSRCQARKARIGLEHADAQHVCAMYPGLCVPQAARMCLHAKQLMPEVHEIGNSVRACIVGSSSSKQVHLAEGRTSPGRGCLAIVRRLRTPKVGYGQPRVGSRARNKQVGWLQVSVENSEAAVQAAQRCEQLARPCCAHDWARARVKPSAQRIQACQRCAALGRCKRTAPSPAQQSSCSGR